MVQEKRNHLDNQSKLSKFRVYPHESESLVFIGFVQERMKPFAQDVHGPEDVTSIIMEKSSKGYSNPMDCCSTDQEMHSMESIDDRTFANGSSVTEMEPKTTNGDAVKLNEVSFSTMNTPGSSRQTSCDQIKSHTEKYDFYS